MKFSFTEVKIPINIDLPYDNIHSILKNGNSNILIHTLKGKLKFTDVYKIKELSNNK